MERMEGARPRPSENIADEVGAELPGIDPLTGARVSRQQAQRFYDRLRRTIDEKLARRGDRVARSRNYLLFVPDVFILLWRLMNERRVNTRNKMLLASAVAYFIMPLDLVPELLFGPVGYLDDLILSVYVLNRILSDTDEEIIREHWSGDGDVLTMMQSVLQSADSLVGSRVVNQIKKWLR